MQRRQKGDKRNSSGRKSDPRYPELSPERIEQLLRTNREVTESDLVEAAASEATRTIESEFADTINVGSEIKNAARPEESSALRNLAAAAESIQTEATTAIEKLQAQYGRSAKKVTSETIFSAAPAGEKSQIVYSESPEPKSNRIERQIKQQKSPTIEPIIEPESTTLSTDEVLTPEPEVIPVEIPKPEITSTKTITEEVQPILGASSEKISDQKFKEFFVNLSFEDLKDIKKLKEKFLQAMDDETILREVGVNTLYAEEFKNRYFENFCQQAEAVLQEHIRNTLVATENSDSKTNKLKAEGGKFLKGIWGGSSYALANRAVMTGLKFVSAPALALKLAGGGLTGAALAGFNYLIGRGFERLNAQNLKKLSTQAEKISNGGLDQNSVFEQLKNDMAALLQFEKQQQVDIQTQRDLAYRLNWDDQKIEEVFSGADINEKRQKINAITSILSVTEAIQKDGDRKYQQQDIKERQILIKSLINNNALEEYATYQVEQTLAQLKGQVELSEEEINKLAIQAELMVSREMNVIWGDVIAQEKFAEIDNKGKSSYEKSYAAKLFGKNPPESLMQALGKGFVSGSMAGLAYSDAIAGAVYMGLQRVQGSLRNEILKQSASEVKTTKEILSNFANFELNNQNIDQAKELITEARARIKLPDIKEVDRAKIELQIQNLQNQMILGAKDIVKAEGKIETKNLAKRIVSQREKEISQAADIATKERARKSFRGLWKTFAKLSRQEKLKTLARAGLEGTKGALAGAMGGELVNAGSAALSGEDYNINQGLDNIYNRVILNTTDTSKPQENIETPVDSNTLENIDTNNVPAKGIAQQIQEAISQQEQASDSGLNYNLKNDFDIEEMIVDTTDSAKVENSDTTIIDTISRDTSSAEQKVQINEIAHALQSGDTMKADTLIKDSTLSPQTIDSVKNLVDLNQKLGLNTFENSLKAEDLDKIICELDNDPKSTEAQTARQGLEHLLKDGSLSLSQYKEIMRQHLAQELNLGNVELVKNAITNSGVDIRTINEAVGRVTLERDLGINTFDNGLDEAELKIINDQIHGGEKSQAAEALLEQLHKDGLITSQQKFSIEHPSVTNAGFKENEQPDSQKSAKVETKYNLSLELGKGEAPKHLEQVFYRLGIDNLDLSKGEVTNVEAAQILNIGANLRVLSEGHDIAGITVDEFNKYVHIEGDKITVTDYDGFQENVIAKLAEHATEIITANNVGQSGAVAYIDNIKNVTWGDMLSAEGIKEENIKFDYDQIQAAESRVFQGQLEKANVGELVTEVNFSDEDSGSFKLENQTITVENNQIIKIGENTLPEPLSLRDKESGEKLITKVSEAKATEFLSMVEKSQAAMMDRLNEQLANQKLQKIEIPESILPKPEYDISAELNSTLNKLGFDNAAGRKEWDNLKKESLSELLYGKTDEIIKDKDDAIKMHNREHMREFFDQAVKNGEIKVEDTLTVERAMKDLMVKETREKLISDIAVAEQKVESVKELEQEAKNGADTLGDQIREEKATKTDINALELYQGLLGKELPVNTLNQMNTTDLEVLKNELEEINKVLKEGPPADSEISFEETENVIKENKTIIEKINKRLENSR